MLFVAKTYTACMWPTGIKDMAASATNLRPLPVQLDHNVLKQLLPVLDRDEMETLCSEFTVYSIEKPHTGVIVWKQMNAVSAFAIEYKQPIIRKQATRQQASPSLLSASPPATPFTTMPFKTRNMTTVMQPKVKREIVLVIQPSGRRSKIIDYNPRKPDTSHARRVTEYNVVGWILPYLGGKEEASYQPKTGMMRKGYTLFNDMDQLRTLLMETHKTATKRHTSHLQKHLQQYTAHPEIVANSTVILPVWSLKSKAWYVQYGQELINARVQARNIYTVSLAQTLLKIVPTLPRLDVLFNIIEQHSIRLDKRKRLLWRQCKQDAIPDKAKSMLSYPIIVCDAFDPKSIVFPWLLRTKNAHLERGKVYVSVNVIYDGCTSKTSNIVTLLAMYLTHLMTGSHLDTMIHMFLNSSTHINVNALGADETDMYDLVSKKRKRQLQDVMSSQTGLQNAPLCIQAALRHTTSFENNHRYQIAAAIVETAKQWGIPYVELATPFYTAIMLTSSDNKKVQLVEFKRALESYAKRPAQVHDKQTCKTRKGPAYSQTELVCPFRNGHQNHVQMCLDSRIGESVYVETATIHEVWTKTRTR